MPRKSMTEHKPSPVVKFRIDKDVETILDNLKARNVNISKFIRESIKCHSIAKKFSLFFINLEVAPNIPDDSKKEFLEGLTPQETELIDSLIGGSDNE